jgi:hypothetical protein
VDKTGSPQPTGCAMGELLGIDQPPSRLPQINFYLGEE